MTSGSYRTGPLLVDPLMDRIISDMRIGDIFSGLIPMGRMKTPNYTMHARDCQILGSVPHWAPQFRAHVKDDHLIVDNLYAMPVGHPTIAYRCMANRMTVIIDATGLPEVALHGCTGRRLRDIVGWGIIPDDLIVSRSEHRPLPEFQPSPLPRHCKQTLLTDQLVLTIEDFAWREYDPPAGKKRHLPSWPGGSFEVADGRIHSTLAELIRSTHPEPVDAELVHQLSIGNPYVVRLRIENAFEPGGRGHTPHLCLRRTITKYPTHAHLRKTKGSWIRRRTDEGLGKVVEWMIPLRHLTEEAVENILSSYHCVITEEDGRLGAYRIRGGPPYGLEHRLHGEEQSSLSSRGLGSLSNRQGRKTFEFIT